VPLTGSHVSVSQEPVHDETAGRDGYARLALAGLIPMVWQQLSGINIIVFYGQSILTMAGLENADALGTTVTAVQFFGILLSGAIIDKVGRRPLLVIGSFLQGCFALLIGGVLSSSQSPSASSVMIPMYGYVLAFALGLGPVPWLLMPELGLPRHLRMLLASVATAANWGISFLVTENLSKLQRAFAGPGRDLNDGLPGVFYLFGVVTLIGFVLIVLLVPETATGACRCGVSRRDKNKLPLVSGLEDASGTRPSC